MQKMVAEYIDEDEGFRKEKERKIVEEGRSVIVESDYLNIILNSSTDLSGISRNRRKETCCSGMLMS